MNHFWTKSCLSMIFLAIFFLNGSLAQATITFGESEAQQKRKGRLYKPFKIEQPKFETPKFDADEFDEIARENEKNFFGRTPGNQSTESNTVTDKEIAKDPHYQAMAQLAKKMDKQRQDLMTSGEMPSSEALLQQYKDVYKEAIKLQREAEKKNARTQEMIDEIERG